ncbi:MAG: hypothetical protein QXM96_01640 [Candidatus Woesearchaeota archaeon]
MLKKLLKSKKADDESFNLLWDKFQNLVIVFGLIFLSLMAFIYSLSNSEFFEKSYLAIDLALIQDTILSSNNKIIYIYDKNMKDFSLIFDEEKVNIEKDSNKFYYYYLINPENKIEKKELLPLIEKTDKQTKKIPIKLIILNDKKIEIFDLNEILINQNEINQKII